MKSVVVAVRWLCSRRRLRAGGAAGEGAYRSGDFPRAVKQIGPAAERGDARAQAYLGFMYQYGRGVPQNYGARGLLVPAQRRAGQRGGAASARPDVRQGLRASSTDHVLAYMWLSLAAAAHQRRRT